MEHIELPMANTADQPTPLFNKETDWDGYVLDSNCIAWMFEMSMDTDVIMAIMRFIPEVVWYAGIWTTPPERLYDTILECFDRSSGRPVVIPIFRNKAYLSAKALLHLAIQRKCIGHESGRAVFKSISNRHPVMGRHYEGDSDLESTSGSSIASSVTSSPCTGRILPSIFPTTLGWATFSYTAPGTFSGKAKLCPMTSRSSSSTPSDWGLPLRRQSSWTVCRSLAC